jgi:transposase
MADSSSSVVAGIDVGATQYYVSVPPERDPRPVRVFGTVTVELERLAAWLRESGVTTVVMESTGVYWVAAFEYLEARDFTVHLVDPHRLMQAPARKTDVRDCQWLRQLQEAGLLVPAFRPSQEVTTLRSLLRLRQMLIAYAGQHVQHMQKALTLMNVKLQHVVSDLTGLTGMRIIKAILDGQRDAASLVALKDPRCKQPDQAFVEALQGHWRDDHLFELRVAVELFETYHRQLAECNRQIEAAVAKFADRPREAAKADTPARLPRRHRNEPTFDARGEVHRVTGVDLTAIEGIDQTTALIILGEVGPDVSKFPTAKHFASWLGLCPGMRRSGGKDRSGRTKDCANRLATALRVCANALHHSKSALGAFLRRLKTRMGAPKAITATAHKLARLVYYMLKHGTTYVEKGVEEYEAQLREKRIKGLQRQARELGFTLQANPS